MYISHNLIFNFVWREHSVSLVSAQVMLFSRIYRTCLQDLYEFQFEKGWKSMPKSLLCFFFFDFLPDFFFLDRQHANAFQGLETVKHIKPFILSECLEITEQNWDADSDLHWNSDWVHICSTHGQICASSYRIHYTVLSHWIK